MIIKENEKQLSFLFQETDSYFEMGYLILKQAKLAGMLPYKRVQQNGKEKLCFQLDAVEKLSDILPKLSENEIIDVLYAVVFMTQRVEENGFMKKECIWCRYDQIYFDRESNSPMFAVLPITQEFRYADGTDWQRSFENCLERIAKYLPEKKEKRVQQMTMYYREKRLDTEGLLEAINFMGNGMSGMLVDRGEEIPLEKNKKLELVYNGKEETYFFEIKERDFVIGRGPAPIDGDLRLSKMVSRIHCKITKVNGNYFVQDLGGLNGTFVNDIQIPQFELMELEHNDILRLADVEFRVRILS